MLKNNIQKLILSSVVILLPIVAGLILWNELPVRMAVHWGADGVSDGFGSRTFAVFGLPAIMLALHWICIFATVSDPKNRGQSPKVFGMVLWICPLVSLFASAAVYGAALDLSFDLFCLVPLLLGIMFVLIGNYLPKCKQNYTIGIKICWALASEENWNATHRFAGKVWFIGGILTMLSAFLPIDFIVPVLIIVLLVLTLLPIVYSYLYYRKQKNAGTAPEKSTSLAGRAGVAFTVIPIILTAVFVSVLCFTGKVEVVFGETSFTVVASYASDLSVEYDRIERIEYRENDDVGVRNFGFGSPRLSVGNFENAEFGKYTRYAYTGCEACIVLYAGDDVLVISGKTATETEEIYKTLLSRIEV